MREATQWRWLTGLALFGWEQLMVALGGSQWRLFMALTRWLSRIVALNGVVVIFMEGMKLMVVINENPLLKTITKQNKWIENGRKHNLDSKFENSTNTDF